MVATFDLSRVAELRRRLGHASTATKVLGAFSVLYLWFNGHADFHQLQGIALALFVFWCALRLSGRIASEDPLIIEILGAWGALWVVTALSAFLRFATTVPHPRIWFLGVAVFAAAVWLFRKFRPADASQATTFAAFALAVTTAWVVTLSLGSFLNPLVFIGLLSVFAVASGTAYLALAIVPVYLIARGLLVLRANRRLPAVDPEKVPQSALSPWGPGGGDMRRHPVFVNWRGRKVYVYVAFCILASLAFRFSYGLGERWNSTPPQGGAVPSHGGVVAGLLGLITFNQVTAAMSYLAIVFLYRRARRHALLPASELCRTDPRPPVLYLRSFGDDRIRISARAANGRLWPETAVKIAFEEVVTDHLWGCGPVVAIGRPGDRLPPLGAARDYQPDETWQQQVEHLMTRASLIVVVVGRTEGVIWEIRRLTDLGLASKLILLFPPLPADNLRARWNDLLDRLDRVGPVALPRDLDLERVRAVVFPRPGTAVVIAAERRDDWAYETVLDAAARPEEFGFDGGDDVRNRWHQDGSQPGGSPHPLRAGDPTAPGSGGPSRPS